MSNKFQITNEDETSKLELNNNLNSSFLIQEESDEPNSKPEGFSPSGDEGEGAQSDTVSVGAPESLPSDIAEQTQFLRPKPKPKPEGFTPRGGPMRPQNFKNTVEQYGLYMNPDKHKPISETKQQSDESEPEEIRRHSSFSSYGGGRESDNYSDLESAQSEQSERSRRSRRSGRSEQSAQLGRKTKKRSETETHFRKKELLRELQDLESRGYKLYNDYNIRSKLEDLENEVKLGQRYFEVKSLKNLGKDGFFTLVSLIEKSTQIFNPMNLKLDGLYTQTLSKRDTIEHEIGAIVKKWVGDEDGVLPPEIKLLGILLFTIFMTHFSNHFSNHLADKMTNPETLNKFNPDTLGNILSFLPKMTSLFSGGSTPAPATPAAPAPVPSNDIRAPPQTSNDINELFSRLMPEGAPPPINPNPLASMMPQSTRQVPLPKPEPTKNTEIDDSKRFFDASSVSDQSTLSDIGGESVITINTNNKKKRGRKRSKKSLKLF